MRKNYESPYPQIVINPVAFLMKYHEDSGRERVIDSIINTLKYIQYYTRNREIDNNDDIDDLLTNIIDSIDENIWNI